MPLRSPLRPALTRRCDRFVSDYRSLDTSNEEAIAQFVSTHRSVMNSIITLSTIFAPTEANFTNYALLRDHVLLPLFASSQSRPYPPEVLSTVHHHVPQQFGCHV